MGLARTVRKMARSTPKPTGLQFRRKTSVREFLSTDSSENAFNIFSGDEATFLDAKAGGKDQGIRSSGGRFSCCYTAGQVYVCKLGLVAQQVSHFISLYGDFLLFQEPPVKVKANYEFTRRQHQIAGIVARGRSRLRV